MIQPDGTYGIIRQHAEMQSRERVLKRLRAQIHINGHIIGVATGSGMTSKYTVMGGADMILALSAGKFRQMGRSSLASFLCYANSNDTVMEFATRELLPIIPETPVLFGLNASDPFIHLYEYIAQIKENGFAGINNFPTVGLIDGKFGESLEEEGVSYDREVEAISIAHFLNLFTIAYVFDEYQAEQMIRAGADVICVHLGLTSGGLMGAKKAISLERSAAIAGRIFKVCSAMKPEVLRMVYGGPIKTPIDMQYLYHTTSCQGFIGGSSVERIPAEKAILNVTKAYKTSGCLDENDIVYKVLRGNGHNYDYIDYVKQFVREHYRDPIYLSDLAVAAHISPNYLSTLFRKKEGCSFTEYLVRFRIERAAEIIAVERIPFVEAANMVGYTDYAQFCKMFKKYKGKSPSEYRQSNINT